MKNDLLSLDNLMPAAGLTVAQVERSWRDVVAKRRATRYLHEAPLLVEPVP